MVYLPGMPLGTHSLLHSSSTLHLKQNSFSEVKPKLARVNILAFSGLALAEFKNLWQELVYEKSRLRRHITLFDLSVRVLCSWQELVYEKSQLRRFITLFDLSVIFNLLARIGLRKVTAAKTFYPFRFGLRKITASKTYYSFGS